MSASHEDQKREEISEQIDPFFKGGPIYRRPFFKIGIIWAIFTLIGILISIFLPRHIMPTHMAHEFGDVMDTMVFFSLLAAPVAAAVWAISAYSLIAWRKMSGKSDTPPEDGVPLRGNTVAVSLWLGISVVLVLVLLVWGMTVLSQQNRPQANTIRINVTGQQWLWTFSYPGTGVSSNVLEVPNNTAIIFQVTSQDVTHGFWPVELGTQIDANPGFITYIQATPDRLGRFDVRCSQLCGLYHSYMYTHGEVVTQSQFKSWLRSQGASASSVNGFTSINKTFAEGKN